jgi:hypothetical protein
MVAYKLTNWPLMSQSKGYPDCCFLCDLQEEAFGGIRNVAKVALSGREAYRVSKER